MLYIYFKFFTTIIHFYFDVSISCIIANAVLLQLALTVVIRSSKRPYKLLRVDCGIVSVCIKYER